METIYHNAVVIGKLLNVEGLWDSYKHVILGSLNYSMLAGAVLVKAPQIINIIKRRSATGLSESSFVIEFIAAISSCLYNMKMGHLFVTWGEMALIMVQCFLQVLLFWRFKEGLSLSPRIAMMVVCWAIALGIQRIEFVGTPLLVLGIFPTITGQISRMPQIVQNFRQRHTGNLSIITWLMSVAGNAVRMFTTIMQVNDPVQLLSHGVAFLANVTLVLQILWWWKATNAAIKKKD